MKRLFDIAAATIGLALSSLVLVPAIVAVWLQDRQSPFYIASRVGLRGRPFSMVKLRSMQVRADATGVTSTTGDDRRITPVGRLVRRWKLDELTQLWNVLIGDMSLVGPRPQVLEHVATQYNSEERELLGVRPGVTDLASIVFADEGEILWGASDPDLRYNQIIRPWKSRLALLYVRRGPNLRTDVRIIGLTILAMFSRRRALAGASALVRQLGGSDELARVTRRMEALREAPPPGASQVVRKSSASLAV